MAKLRGIKNITDNLNKELGKMKKASVKGLIEASIIIRRDMDKTPPIIPIDQGNLRSSWFVTTANKTAKGQSPKFKGDNAGKMNADHNRVISSAKGIAMGFRWPVVVMGFTAEYATDVHEDQEKERKRPNSGAHFFKASLDRNKREVLKTLAENTKI